MSRQYGNKYTKKEWFRAVTPIGCPGGLDPKRNLGVNKYIGPDEWHLRGLPPISDNNCSSATVGVTPMITAVVVVGTVTWITHKY